MQQASDARFVTVLQGAGGAPSALWCEARAPFALMQQCRLGVYCRHGHELGARQDRTEALAKLV